MFYGRIALQGPFGPVKAVQNHDKYLELLHFGSQTGVVTHWKRVSSIHKPSGESVERRILIRCAGFVKPGANLGGDLASIRGNLSKAAGLGLLFAYDSSYKFGEEVELTGREMISQLTKRGLVGFTCLVAKPGAAAKKAFGVE
jgi:hypothetical protein